MEFFLFFLLPLTLIIYGIGLFVWVGVYLIKYTDGWSKAERQQAAQKLLQSPIWPAITFGIFLQFLKELRATARGEEVE